MSNEGVEIYGVDEVVDAMVAYYGAGRIGQLISLDLSTAKSMCGVTVTISKEEPKEEVKLRQLKRLGQLKGETIISVKAVKQGTKA